MTKPTNNQITSAERLVDATFGTGEAAEKIATAKYQALDYFLSIPKGPARAAHWLQLTTEQKRHLVGLRLVRQFGDAKEIEIDHFVAMADNEYGAQFLPSELATLGALEDSRDRAVSAEWSAVQRGDTEEVKFFARERAASERALRMFLAGIRAAQQADGSWSVPSEESSLVYVVTRAGACNCPAGRNERLCKHVALVSAVETGIDNLSQFDDYDPEPEYVEAAAAALGSRLAAARKLIMEAA